MRQYYFYFFSAKWDSVLALLAPEIIHTFNNEDVGTGIAKFQEFLNIKHSHYREQQKELSVTVDLTGNKAFAKFILEGHYIATYPGLPEARQQYYRIDVETFFELNRDKISRIATYFDFAEWINQINQNSGVAG